MNDYMKYLAEHNRYDFSIHSVFSFLARHRRTIVTHVSCERQSNSYRILVHYKSTATNKTHYEPFSFYRNAEEKLADQFINEICDTFSVTLSGDPIL